MFAEFKLQSESRVAELRGQLEALKADSRKDDLKYIISDYVKQCQTKSLEIDDLKSEISGKAVSLTDLELKNTDQREQILSLKNNIDNLKTSEQLRKFVEGKVQSMENE